MFQVTTVRITAKNRTVKVEKDLQTKEFDFSREGKILCWFCNIAPTGRISKRTPNDPMFFSMIQDR